MFITSNGKIENTIKGSNEKSEIYIASVKTVKGLGLKKQIIKDENDPIESGMDQYIIDYEVECDEDLNVLIDKLSSLHTDTAKEIGLKPIIFKKYNLSDEISHKLPNETEELKVL